MRLEGGLIVVGLVEVDAVGVGLILDDVEAAFFTTDQHALMQRFVSDRGGGLLMLGIMGLFANSGLYEMYGSTEAGWVTILKPEEQLTKLGSVGREVVGSGPVRLLAPDGSEVADGEAGELFSRTPWSFDGYWQLPDKTAEAFRGEYCSVGDLARRGPGLFHQRDRHRDHRDDGRAPILQEQEHDESGHYRQSQKCDAQPRHAKAPTHDGGVAVRDIQSARIGRPYLEDGVLDEAQAGLVGVGDAEVRLRAHVETVGGEQGATDLVVGDTISQTTGYRAVLIAIAPPIVTTTRMATAILGMVRSPDLVLVRMAQRTAWWVAEVGRLRKTPLRHRNHTRRPRGSKQFSRHARANRPSCRVGASVA